VTTHLSSHTSDASQPQWQTHLDSTNSYLWSEKQLTLDNKNWKPSYQSWRPAQRVISHCSTPSCFAEVSLQTQRHSAVMTSAHVFNNRHKDSINSTDCAQDWVTRQSAVCCPVKDQFHAAGTTVSDWHSSTCYAI